jgi:hypothetical protein
MRQTPIYGGPATPLATQVTGVLQPQAAAKATSAARAQGAVGGHGPKGARGGVVAPLPFGGQIATLVKSSYICRDV